MTERHFTPPWHVVELEASCIIVTDDAGQKLAIVYFEERQEMGVLPSLAECVLDGQNSSLEGGF